ncbi:putative conserved membrane protein [Synechococcus sp. A18-40]|nr:putative conserved membrane protein [Synechococcus sp. A18-40]
MAEPITLLALLVIVGLLLLLQDSDDDNSGGGLRDPVLIPVRVRDQQRR